MERISVRSCADAVVAKGDRVLVGTRLGNNDAFVSAPVLSSVSGTVKDVTLRMTTPAAVAGTPALSIPLLTVRSQLGPAPVGVCLVSRSGTDIALVRLGRRLAAL